MFTKRNENQFGLRVVKAYTFEPTVPDEDPIKLIALAGLPIEKVFVSGDDDVGMKYDDGEYTLDEFLTHYNSVTRFASKVAFSGADGQFSIVCDEYDNFILRCSDPNLDLSDMIQKKSGRTL